MTKLLLGLLIVFGAPALASAQTLVKVSPSQHSAVVKAVNAYLKETNGRPRSHLTVLVNSDGRGLAFNKTQITRNGISNPFAFTVKSGGKIEQVSEHYWAPASALNGNF